MKTYAFENEPVPLEKAGLIKALLDLARMAETDPNPDESTLRLTLELTTREGLVILDAFEGQYKYRVMADLWEKIRTPEQREITEMDRLCRGDLP